MEAREQKAICSQDERGRRNSVIDKGYDDHIFYYSIKKKGCIM